jgi:hypothetical protein
MAGPSGARCGEEFHSMVFDLSAARRDLTEKSFDVVRLDDSSVNGTINAVDGSSVAVNRPSDAAR